MPSRPVLRKARKRYRCDEAFPGCYGRIQPGDPYVRCTVFPSDLPGWAAPRQFVECFACAVYYGHDLTARRSA